MHHTLRDFASAILLDGSGRLLLQRRDQKDGIAHPGKVSCFGGRRERGESHLECIVREVAEETGVHLPPERFEHLITLNAPDPEKLSSRIHGVFYVARNIDLGKVDVTEGKLLIVEAEGVVAIGSELTPLTKIVLNRFFEQA